MAKRKMPASSNSDAKDRQSSAAVALAEWAAQVLHVADQLKLRSRVVSGVKLTAARRAALSMLPELDGPLAAKLAGRSNRFTVGDVASLLLASAVELTNAEPAKLAALGIIVVDLPRPARRGTRRGAWYDERGRRRGRGVPVQGHVARRQAGDLAADSGSGRHA